MELENLKKLWNKDLKNIPEISLQKRSEIHSPLQMIKINMRTEFYILLITLPVILLSFPFATDDFNLKIISILQIILTLGFITYFYSRFKKLYNLLAKSGINTNYEMFNIKTQLLVAKEIYISYYISYIPLAFVLCLIQISFHFDTDYHMLIFGISFGISFLIVCFFIKYWVYYMYGKYIEIVSDVVDELNGEKQKTKKDNKQALFERSQLFFIKKYGIKGNVLNIIIWFIAGYALIIILFTIVFLIIILIGQKLNLIDPQTFLKVLDNLN